MSELRLIGKTTDGAYLTLVDVDGNEYTLRISDTLRATVNQPRLAAVQENEDGTITLKVVQARLRAGETIEALAKDTGWTTEKVERFAGPILQERSYIISLAQDAVIRKDSEREPVSFSETVTAKLVPRQVDMAIAEWDSWRLEDGHWIIQLKYPTREGLGTAQWNFDTTRSQVTAIDESARWILGEESAPRERPSTEHGLVYGNHPSGTRMGQGKPAEGREGPRLVSIRETPDTEEEEDGVSARAKVPSWDEIMFGGSKNNNNDDDA